MLSLLLLTGVKNGEIGEMLSYTGEDEEEEKGTGGV
jgi:hypothetical protein